MNHFVVGEDHVVCPRPRRLAAIIGDNHIHHHHPFRVLSDGADLLDIILNKGSSSAHVASSPPFFNGSPPSRASNPLIQDASFRDEKLSTMAALPVAYSPSSAAHKGGGGGGCARMKFGLKPAAVRVEGFDCLSRDRHNSRVSAVA